jgi:hypothetical protein
MRGYGAVRNAILNENELHLPNLFSSCTNYHLLREQTLEFPYFHGLGLSHGISGNT